MGATLRLAFLVPALAAASCQLKLNGKTYSPSPRSPSTSSSSDDQSPGQPAAESPSGATDETAAAERQPSPSTDVAPVPAGAWAAGRPPTWCKGYKRGDRDPERSLPNDPEWIDGGYKAQDPSGFAHAACFSPNDPERLKEVATWAAKFKEQTGGGDQDFAEFMALGLVDRDQREKQHEGQCNRFKVSPDEALDDGAKAEQLAYAYALDCDGADSKFFEVINTLDRPQLTEVQRVVVARHCLDHGLRDRKLGNLLYCGGDLKALDRGKLDQELAQLKVSGWARHFIVRTFNQVRRDGAVVAKQYSDLARKNPAWKELLAASEKGWATWMKTYEANKSTFDAIRAFEQKLGKGSKKAVAGCSAQLRPLWNKLLASQKVGSLDQLRAAAVGIVGYPLTIALIKCDFAEKNFLVGELEKAAFVDNDFVDDWADPSSKGGKGGKGSPRTKAGGRRGAIGHAGPRLEAALAALGALAEIEADQENFPLRAGDIPVPRPSSAEHDDLTPQGLYDANIRRDAPALAQIKSVGSGDPATVSFKTVRWKASAPYSCVETKKVLYYETDADGIYPIYEHKCKYKMQDFSSTEEPVSIPAAFTKGLKPGMMIKVAVRVLDGKRFGIPISVWSNEKMEKWLGAFGLMW